MIQARPYKLRSGDWGVKIEPKDENLPAGTVVEVVTRKGTYRAALTNLVFSGDADAVKGWESCSIYGMSRLPDLLQDGPCPVCGAPPEAQTVKPVETNAQAEERERPRGNGRSWASRQSKRDHEPPKAEDPDDDVPF